MVKHTIKDMLGPIYFPSDHMVISNKRFDYYLNSVAALDVSIIPERI